MIFLGLSIATGSIPLLLLVWNIFFSESPEQVTWRCFVKKYLQLGLVRRVEIVNKSWARAVMKFPSSNSNVWMAITNIDGFERNFDYEVQRLNLLELELDYTSEIELSSVWNAAVKVILLIPFIAFLLVVYLVIIAVIFNAGNLLEESPIKKTMVKAFYEQAKILNGTDIEERFSDVVGCDNAKLEITELVSYLTHPEIYYEIGAKAPRGALLTGPPGTGKTLLAKAAAGEAGVTFIFMSGSEFNEIFVGMGALKTRELFSLAREKRPCIIFIDEIDSIGKKRQDGKFSSGEADNTLNQLLVEMDGFNTRDGVLVLAATNRADVLDKALLRPGRFDRLIKVPVPDIDGREELFKIHLSPIRLSTALLEESLAKKLAFLTPGFTGAQIAQVCNDAALLALRQKQPAVQLENFELAILRNIAGHGNSAVKLSENERRVVAYHEAGHAVAGWFSKHADQLLKITILPLGDSLGHTQFLSQELNLYTKEQLMDQLVVTMGGRVAEEMIFGKVTTGAVHDLQRVTKIAYESIKTFGMNAKLGPVSFVDEQPLSQELTKNIELEVQLLAESAENAAKELLGRHAKEVHTIAEALLEKSTLTVEDVIGLIGPRPFRDENPLSESITQVGEDAIVN